MSWYLHRKPIQASKCLKVTKAELKFKLYTINLFFFTLLLPFLYKGLSPAPSNGALLTTSGLMLPDLNLVLLKEIPEVVICLTLSFNCSDVRYGTQRRTSTVPRNKKQPGKVAHWAGLAHCFLCASGVCRYLWSTTSAFKSAPKFIWTFLSSDLVWGQPI